MTINEINGRYKKPIFIGLFFLFAFSATFVHQFFLKLDDWKPFTAHYKTYDEIKEKSREKSKQLLNDLKNHKLDVPSYVKAIENNELQKKQNLETYYQKKKRLMKDFSFLGFTSFRYFLYVLGFAIFPLIVTSLLLKIVLRFKNQIQYKRIYVYGCVGFIYISAFWLCHTLFATVDLPTWSYNISFALLTILVTAIIYWFTSLYNTISAKKRAEEEEWHEFITNSYELLDLLKDHSDLIENSIEDDDK